MVKISACVITKNEEVHIGQWLRTMRKITKDLIVVDTGSTDKTVELAKAGGAKVYHFEWIDDFAAAKNYAIEQATGDWILFLDADEYFTEPSLPNVRKIIERHHRNPQIEVFLCKLIDVDADRDNALLDEFYNVRIFRNVPWLRYQNKVHETLQKTNGKIELTVISDGVEILHTGYTQSIVVGKLKRNLAILQKEIAEEGEQPRHYRFLSDCYYGLDQYELALKYAKLHIESDRRSLGRDNTMQKRIIDCLDLMQVGEEKVIDEINAQIIAYPDDPEFLWYKAEYLARMGEFAQAELYFAKMFALNEGQKDDLDISRFKARKVRAFARLAEIAVKKGDSTGAEAGYREAIRCHKYNEALFLRWYRYLRQNDPVEVIGTLRSIYGKTERELLFVYKLIQMFPESKVHIYYQKLIEDTLDMKAVTSAAGDLSGAGQYAKAKILLGEALEDEYVRLLLCATMDRKGKDASELQLLLPQRHKRVLCALRGEQISLVPEEKILYESIKNRISACQNDLQRPLDALRTRYLETCRQTKERMNSSNMIENEMGLLKLIEPSAKSLHILTLDCDETMLSNLKRLFSQAVVQAKTAIDLPIGNEERYHWIILGEPLNTYRDPINLLKNLCGLLGDGFLMFTVENALYWKHLRCLLEEEEVSLGESAQLGITPFTSAMFVRCMRATKFSDIVIEAEEVEQEATAEILREKLESVGLLRNARHFYTRRWHVRAGKMSADTYALQSILLPEERCELVFLLRRVENDIDAQKNAAVLLRFCEEKKVEASYLAALIANSMIQKKKLLLRLATVFFEQGAQKLAIRLLIASLKSHMQEPEFIYTLAFLLNLSGARKEALKVLEQFQGKDSSVEALREELIE